MQSTANTETDRAIEVVPEISHTVPWRVTSVLALSACKSTDEHPSKSEHPQEHPKK